MREPKKVNVVLTDKDKASGLDPHPTREQQKVDMVSTTNSSQDQMLEPPEVSKTPVDSGQSNDPDLEPSEVLKTPGKWTTIEEIIDQDNPDPEPHPKRVPKLTAKKAVILEERNQKDVRRA